MEFCYLNLGNALILIHSGLYFLSTLLPEMKCSFSVTSFYTINLVNCNNILIYFIISHFMSITDIIILQYHWIKWTLVHLHNYFNTPFLVRTLMGSVNSWGRPIFLVPSSIQGSALHINNSIIIIESYNISIQNPTCPTSSSESKFCFLIDNLVSIINGVPRTYDFILK